MIMRAEVCIGRAQRLTQKQIMNIHKRNLFQIDFCSKNYVTEILNLFRPQTRKYVTHFKPQSYVTELNLTFCCFRLIFEMILLMLYWGVRSFFIVGGQDQKLLLLVIKVVKQISLFNKGSAKKQVSNCPFTQLLSSCSNTKEKNTADFRPKYFLSRPLILIPFLKN